MTEAEEFAEFLAFVQESTVLPVPDVAQIHNYDCGAAATQSVCRYFEVGPTDEKDYIKALGTTPADGTEPEAIIAYLQAQTLQVDARAGMTLADLQTAFAAGKPVICAIQDYGTTRQEARNDSGHYVVVVGIGLGLVLIQDPSADNVLQGSDSIAAPGLVPVHEDAFLGLWHDVGKGGKVLSRYGITVGKALPVLESLTPPTKPGVVVGLGGKAGEELTSLLDSATAHGFDVLHSITSAAIRRLLKHGHPISIQQLFSHSERQALTDALSATLGTSDQLARAQLRQHQAKLERQHGGIRQESENVLEGLGDLIRPLAPQAALDYFRSLVPSLGDDPKFGDLMQRQAFTLAAATETELLNKVQAAIADALATGKVIDGPKAIQDLLDAAGVSPRNPGYADMVFRTNAMDAYNQAADEERRAPDVIDTFPAWQYLNPADGRSRPSHAARDGNYYPAEVAFRTVRGEGIDDAANCRCVPRPVDKWSWAKLTEQGAEFSAA